MAETDLGKKKIHEKHEKRPFFRKIGN